MTKHAHLFSVAKVIRDFNDRLSINQGRTSSTVASKRDIETVILEAFRSRMGQRVLANEMRSWKESLSRDGQGR